MRQPRKGVFLGLPVLFSVLYLAGFCWSDEQKSAGPKFVFKSTGGTRHSSSGPVNPRSLGNISGITSVISSSFVKKNDHASGLSCLLGGDDMARQKRASLRKTEERSQPGDYLRTRAARTTWARTYGDPYDDYVSSAQTTGDGGYIVAGGSRRQTEVTIQEALVLKLSSDGEIEWQYAYSGIEEASSIRQTSEGGYIVSGATMITDKNDGDFWLLKLNSGGSVEWQRIYGGDGNDRAYSVWPTTDGGFVVAGTTESFKYGDEDVWILRLSSAGQIEWQRRCGDAADEVVESIRQTGDGGYIAAGHSTPFGSGLSDFLVQKLTSTGEVEWQRTYGEEWDDMAHSILQTGDGGYLVVGEISQRIAVIKLSPAGDIEWQRIYWGYGSDNGFARSVKPTVDGGYIIAGTINAGIRGKDIFLMKFSSAGDLEWQRTFGGQRNEDQGLDIEPLGDGGYIVAGQTQAFGAGNSDILILRLDPSGQIERFPEISGVTFLQPGDSSLVAQDMTPRSRETSAAALPADIPYYSADKKTWLIFSPPYLSGKRVLNRSLSQAEYVDVLTWEPNPNNSDLDIVSYRLFLDDGAYDDQRLADLDPDERTFWVRDVSPDAWRTYSLCGITDKGEEGMRRFVTIKEKGWQLRCED